MAKTIQNFYKTTISLDWSIGLGNFYVTTKPIPTEGWLVLSPNNSNTREIIAYTSTGTDSNGDYVTVSQRGVGGTSEQTHTVGEPIRMNVTAEYIKDINDDIDNIVAAGAPNADTTTKGLVELSTNAQAKNGTTDGETGAKLVPSNTNASMVKRSTSAITGTATPVLDIDSYDRFVITPDRDITSVNVSGTPIDGQRIDIQIKNTSGQKDTGLLSVGTSYAIVPGTSLVVDKPTGTMEGDIMFALYSNAAEYASTIPSGWTRIAQQISSNYFDLFYKVATAGEPANYTWGLATGYAGFISIETKRGTFNLANPIESFSSVPYITGGTDVIAGSVTTTKDNQYVLTFSAFYNTSSTTFTPPTNYTETFDNGSTNPDLWHEHAFRLVPTAGATSTLTTTASTSSSTKHSFAVVLSKDVYSVTLGSTFKDLSSVYSNGVNNYELEYNTLLSKWIQRSDKTYTYTSGIKTYDVATASGTQLIPHGLGRIPKKIRIRSSMVTTAVSSTSTGIFDTTNKCMYLIMNEGSSTAQTDVDGSSSTYSIMVATSTAMSAMQTGIITVDANNITITWTKTGSPTGTAILLWEAE